MISQYFIRIYNTLQHVCLSAKYLGLFRRSLNVSNKISLLACFEPEILVKFWNKIDQNYLDSEQICSPKIFNPNVTWTWYFSKMLSGSKKPESDHRPSLVYCIFACTALTEHLLGLELPGTSFDMPRVGLTIVEARSCALDMVTISKNWKGGNFTWNLYKKKGYSFFKGGHWFFKNYFANAFFTTLQIFEMSNWGSMKLSYNPENHNRITSFYFKFSHATGSQFNNEFKSIILGDCNS